MTTLSFTLVILSTFTHAYWNYVLKKTEGGLLFVWLFTLLTTVLYVPVILYSYFAKPFSLTPTAFIYLAGSVLFHLLYFFFLDKAYYFGDLSVIYPMTRSIAPLFTITFALMVFKESLSLSQAISITLILGGTFLLSGMSFAKKQSTLPAIAYALLCAMMIAGYTLIDKQIVAGLAITPFLLDFFNNLGRVIILSPLVLKDPVKQKKIITHHFKEALIIAVFSPLSYLLVLFALRTTPVSLIAPLRQFSIILASIMGIRLLYESTSYLKLSGIAITFMGVVGMCIY